MTKPESPQQTTAISIEQAFQKAVVHHQAGRFQDAVRLYSSILQSQPTHPEVNHNMGILAVQLKQPDAGLPSFMAALDADPTRGQYWLSYIGALFQAGQLETARTVLGIARQQGLQGDGVEALAAQLEGTVQASSQLSAEQKHTFDDSSSVSSTELQNIEKTFKTKPAKQNKSTEKTSHYNKKNPSPKKINALLTLFNKRRYAEVASIAEELVNRFPHFGLGWKALGESLIQMRHLEKALFPMQRNAALFPQDAVAHNNLGALLLDLGWIDESEVSCRRALQINPDYAEAHNNLGRALYLLGRKDEALACWRRALQLSPDMSAAHNSVGVILMNQGQINESEACFRRALKINPDYAEAHNNLGRNLALLDQKNEALACFRQALQISPNMSEAHSNMGNVLFEMGQIDGAEISYRQAIKANPDYSPGHANLAAALHKLGRIDDAVISCQRALEINPDYADAYNNMAACLFDLHRPDEAAASCMRAIQIDPGHLKAYKNLTTVLLGLNRLIEGMDACQRALHIKQDDAEVHSVLSIYQREFGQLESSLASARRALEIDPNLVTAHVNLGVSLSVIGRPDEALLSIRKAQEIKPDCEEAYHHEGHILSGLGQTDKALASYHRALEIKPDYPEVYSNLGNLLKDIGQSEKGVASYLRALELKPDFFNAHSNLLFTLKYIPGQSPSYYLEQARKFGQVAASKVSTRFTTWKCSNQPKRLRVGMVSGDLRNHSAGHFLEALILNIDQTRIELIAYPTQTKEDDLTARIRPRFSAWNSLVGKSDSEAARLIHDDGIHVLLDLSGHTGGTRLPVFAWKPAPVQAMWLGFFASTGLAEMDYIIGDKWLLPDGEEDHFIEKGWRLPGASSCLTIPKVDIPVGELPALRKQSITFGSLNNLSKMNDQVMACWAGILSKIPDSQLYLNTGALMDINIRKRITERFSAYGIEENRLILEATIGRAVALNSYNKIDIALDPFPYPGGTSSFEALWMGVPILTMRGNDYLSHLGESIMHNAGLPDWIAANEEDYITKAIAFAGNLENLVKLRGSLRTKVLASPLFDQTRFARDFEAALWGMWQARNNNSKAT